MKCSGLGQRTECCPGDIAFNKLYGFIDPPPTVFICKRRYNKAPQVGVLCKRNLASHSYGHQNSKIKKQEWSTLKTPFLAYRWPFILCLHTVSLPYVYLCPSILFLWEHQSYWISTYSLLLFAIFCYHYFFKCSVLSTVTS